MYSSHNQEVQDEQAKIEIAYVNVANQFLVHQLERLREVVSVEKGVVKSESIKMAIMNEMSLLGNNKCEDELLQLLLSKQEKEFRDSEGLAFFSGKVLTKREEVKQSLQPLLLPKLNFNKVTLATINEHLNKYDPVANASISRVYRRENPRLQLPPQIIETTILSKKKSCNNDITTTPIEGGTMAHHNQDQENDDKEEKHTQKQLEGHVVGGEGNEGSTISAIPSCEIKTGETGAQAADHQEADLCGSPPLLPIVCSDIESSNFELLSCHEFDMNDKLAWKNYEPRNRIKFDDSDSEPWWIIHHRSEASITHQTESLLEKYEVLNDDDLVQCDHDGHRITNIDVGVVGNEADSDEWVLYFTDSLEGDDGNV